MTSKIGKHIRRDINQSRAEKEQEKGREKGGKREKRKGWDEMRIKKRKKEK